MLAKLEVSLSKKRWRRDEGWGEVASYDAPLLWYDISHVIGYDIIEFELWECRPHRRAATLDPAAKGEDTTVRAEVILEAESTVDSTNTPHSKTKDPTTTTTTRSSTSQLLGWNRTSGTISGLTIWASVRRMKSRWHRCWRRSYRSMLARWSMWPKLERASCTFPSWWGSSMTWMLWTILRGAGASSRLSIIKIFWSWFRRQQMLSKTSSLISRMNSDRKKERRKERINNDRGSDRERDSVSPRSTMMSMSGNQREGLHLKYPVMTALTGSKRDSTLNSKDIVITP